jgi:hypothetical protein
VLQFAILFLAQPADAPVVPDGARLQAGSRCYTIFSGDKAIGQTWQRIRATSQGGVARWDVIVHQRMADGAFDLRDHFVLRRADLRAIEMDSRKNGVEQVRVRYSDGAIETVFAGKAPAETKATGALWDGNLWGLTFAALPLADAKHFVLPFYHYEKGLGHFTLDVVGSEVVDGRPAWIVEADAGDGRKVRYQIAKQSGDELGYSAGRFRQSVGGDCAGLIEP